MTFLFFDVCLELFQGDFMALAGCNKGVGEQFHQDQVVRVINPAVGDAVKILESIFGVRPQTTLQGVGCPAPVAHFANVATISVVETKHGMFAPIARFLQSDAHYALSGSLGVKYEDVASLFLLVVDERQDIQTAKLSEYRVIPNFCECLAFNHRPN